MRVASFNVNGIRAAVRRGYVDWQQDSKPDVVCLQEVRAPVAAIPAEAVDGYHLAYHEGDRAGRNGVALLTRIEPEAVRFGFAGLDPDAFAARPADPDPDGFDAQGRYLEVDLPGVTIASLYLPKGDVYQEKYAAKMRFLALLQQRITTAAAAAAAPGGREYLLCGDFNIAPAEADIRSWKTNLKSEGFLPEERSWIGALIGPAHPADSADGAGSADTAAAAGAVVDVVRRLRPDEVGPFSWWSWRGKAFDNDAGWRIDHHLATPGLAGRATDAWVDRAESYDRRISDHAPVLVDYDT